jgi:hypothetical protein
VSQLSEIKHVIADRIVASGLDSRVNVFAYPPRDYPLPAVLIVDSPDDYVDYHGTFGSLRLQTVELIVRIIVPEGGSAQSAGERLDEYLSSGSTEDASLADAITGSDVTIGSSTADIFAARATNRLDGDLARATTTPVVSCDIPVRVALKRS